MAGGLVYTQRALFEDVATPKTLGWEGTEKSRLTPWEQGIYDEEHGVPWARSKVKPSDRGYARYMSGRHHAKGVAGTK